MNEDDTFERLRRPSLEEMTRLHRNWIGPRPHRFISLESSEAFFQSHNWDREEYIMALPVKAWNE
jgi:hypothetical protein